jgi:hypothetical protein
MATDNCLHFSVWKCNLSKLTVLAEALRFSVQELIATSPLKLSFAFTVGSVRARRQSASGTLVGTGLQLYSEVRP